jgi:hypothetical protein
MKIWIGAHPYSWYVEVFTHKPASWAGSYWGTIGDRMFRALASRLLRGSGLRLPRHGTKQLVEVEIFARRPKLGSDKPKRIVTQYLKPRRKK